MPKSKPEAAVLEAPVVHTPIPLCEVEIEDIANDGRAARLTLCAGDEHFVVHLPKRPVGLKRKLCGRLVFIPGA